MATRLRAPKGRGTVALAATDDAFTAGGVGLWTKVDSVTCFDDFRVNAK